jgi:hypothetical protein
MPKEKVKVILDVSTEEGATFYIGNLNMKNKKDKENILFILKCKTSEMIETVHEIKNWFSVEWFAADMNEEETELYQEQVDTMAQILFINTLD